MEDNQILSLLLARNEQGIKELEARYGIRLKHLAMGILSEEDAFECVNDTYLAVWNSIPPKKPEYLFAYTAKICRNLALNRLEWEGAAKRNLFLRRYWYGESIKELAAVFGYRESKVKSILFRLRNQLWKELKKEELL